MKKSDLESPAFTLVELLVVIAIIAVLAVVQLPALANTKAKVQRVNCSGNLKRVGIAFRTWSDNKNGRMPMQVPANQGGAQSAVGFRATGANFNANMPSFGPLGVFGMFCVMSNELTTPRILFCPSDARATYIQGTIFGNSSGSAQGYYSDFQASYAIGVDANDAAPNMILTADANLGDGATPPIGNNVYGETSSAKGKFITLGTNTTWVPISPGWANSTHALQGNVGFVDGSVQNLTTTQFRSALNKTGDTGRSASTFVQANGSFGSGVNRVQFP
jgi:prepilin-type N-terminal cleavage/methylation domain-containing protein/prepilin-type processing-associated H-X9-DG protein